MTFSFIDVKVPGGTSQNNEPQMLTNAYQSTNQPALLEQATPEIYDIISKELDRVKDFDVDTIIEQRSKYINQQNLNEGGGHVVLAAVGAAVAHHLGHSPVHGAAIGATLPIAARATALGAVGAGLATYGAGKGVHHIIKKGVEHFHKKVTIPYHKKQADHHEKMRDHHANHDEQDDDDHSYKAELHHDAYEKHTAAMKDHSKSSEAKAATAKVHAKNYKYDQGDHAKLMGRNESFNEGLKGDQHEIDVAAPKGKIDSKDFEMLRMKKKKKKMDSPTKDEPEGENGDTAAMNPKIGDKTKKEYSMSMKPSKKKLYMSKEETEYKGEVMKESSIRTALKSVVENRGEHYRSATPPETMDDKLKGGGAKKMKADFMKGAKMNDTVAKAPEDAKAAGLRGPSAKPRNAGDNTRNGDSKIVQGGTPMKDPSSPKQRLESIMNAYSSMYEDIHHMKVDNYQTTGGDGGTNVHKKYNLKMTRHPDKSMRGGPYGDTVIMHGKKQDLHNFRKDNLGDEGEIKKGKGVHPGTKSEATVNELSKETLKKYAVRSKGDSIIKRATAKRADREGEKQHTDARWARNVLYRHDREGGPLPKGMSKRKLTKYYDKASQATTDYRKKSFDANKKADKRDDFRKMAKGKIMKKYGESFSGNEATVNELSIDKLSQYRKAALGDIQVKTGQANIKMNKATKPGSAADLVAKIGDRQGHAQIAKGKMMIKKAKGNEYGIKAPLPDHAKSSITKKRTESFSGTGVGTLSNIMDAYQSMNQPPSLLEQATQEMYDIVSHELDRVKDFDVDTIIEQRSSDLTELPPLEESVKLAAIGAAIAHHLGHDPVHGAAIGATLPITAPLAVAGTAGAVYGAVKGGQAIHKGIKNMAKAGHDHFKKHVLGKSPEKKPEKKSKTYVSGDMVHVRR